RCDDREGRQSAGARRLPRCLPAGELRARVLPAPRGGEPLGVSGEHVILDNETVVGAICRDNVQVPSGPWVPVGASVAEWSIAQTQGCLNLARPHDATAQGAPPSRSIRSPGPTASS